MSPNHSIRAEGPAFTDPLDNEQPNAFVETAPSMTPRNSDELF